MEAQAPLDERTRGMLRWRCRRGLLENDLFIERFFARHGATLDETQARALTALMDLSDNDLLELLLARREPAAGELDDEMLKVMRMMRAPTDPRCP